MFGEDTSEHTFNVGDRVRIARIAGTCTCREIIGHRGVIIEVDDISPSSVEMKCATCGGVHTMHEQELDFFGDDLVQLVQEKAGVPHDNAEIDEASQNLEDMLAVGMHKAGFDRICIQNRDVPAGDPEAPRPTWQKYVYGVITRLAPFRVYHDALIKIARDSGGYLVEWASYSHKSGYNGVITDSDLDTLTLEMPIRALIVSKRDTTMGVYDDIKEMVTYWLQDAHQIDIGAIFRRTRELGWKMGNWEFNQHFSQYRLNLTLAPTKTPKEVFMEWASAHWEWEGKFLVSVTAPGATGWDNVEITKKPGEPPTVEEEQDVPF